MGGVTMLDKIMSAFKAPTNYGRYFFEGGVGNAQRLVDGLTQGELRGFGLDNFIIVRGSNPEQPVVSFGRFGDEVNVTALFHRLDQLFEIGRLPESKRANALMVYPRRGDRTQSAESCPQFIVPFFGALKASGAELSSHLPPVFTKPKPHQHVHFSPQSGTSRGMLIATIEQGDVKLTCRTEVTCQQATKDSYTIGPLTLKEVGDGMSFEASLPRHGFAMMGHQVLESGLRTILSPLVEGNTPVSMFPMGESLAVGIHGTVADRYIQEASEELGIGMDGTVTLPG